MGLLRANGNFRRLWIAQSVSDFGNQVSMLALPLIAVVTLRASTFEAGVLAAASSVSWLAIGLLVGAWVDRMRRRPVMIVADVLRAALLISLPVASALGSLTLLHLYAVALGVGICSVFFDVADPSYLPTVVTRDDLVEANAKLQTSTSVAYWAGPTIAGALVQWLTAPVAVVADVLSFVWSAAFVGSIRTREEARAPRRPDASMLRQIREGFSVVFDRPVLRAIALYNTTVVTFWSLARAIGVVFLVRTVHLSAGVIGLLYSVSGLGAVVGALVAMRLSRWLGTGRSLLAAAFLTNAFMLLMPLTAGGWRLAARVLRAGERGRVVLRHRVQHRLDVVPAKGLPRPPARPDERHHAIHQLGFAAAGQPRRRLAGDRHRHPADAMARLRWRVAWRAVARSLAVAAR